MIPKTLEQEEVPYEFDAQRYSLFGKPLGTDHVLIVRTEDGRARFTTRELDGSLAIGQLQLGTAAAEEILRLIAAATARDKEIEEKDERISNLSHSCVAAIERAIGAERELAALLARVKELIDAANIMLGNDEYDTYWPQYQARVREAIKAFEIPLPEGKSTNNKEHNV